jgi:DNA invertase Pin-like site-specific DNA recombinase
MLRDILLAVMASLAKMESKKISERTRAGMERARVKGTESGKPIGRPALDSTVQRKIAKHLDEGLSTGGLSKGGRGHKSYEGCNHSIEVAHSPSAITCPPCARWTQA